MKQIFLLLLLLNSCITHRSWLEKGKDKGWIDSATTTHVDTFKTSVFKKDSFYLHSFDTIRLIDKHFTTKYFYDTSKNVQYLQTIINPRDSVVYKTIHTTSYKGMGAMEIIEGMSWKFILLLLLILFIIFGLLNLKK